MKAVAIGDLLLPASVFDETIRSASWVTAYDSFDWDVTKKRDELRNVVRRMETGGSRAFLPTPEELERLKDAEVILSHLFTIPREVFEAAPKLRYILSARGGVENIDLKAAHEHGISVIHCPAHNAIAVTEYAVGGNESCAKLSGINVKAIKLIVYTFSGFCCGIAALLLTSRLDSAVPTNAEGYEMNAIAAVVIGGTSMSGGEGSLIGTVIGTMLIGVIANGMNLLLIPTGPQRMVTGSIIVIAVIVDVLRKKANSKSK